MSMWLVQYCCIIGLTKLRKVYEDGRLFASSKYIMLPSAAIEPTFTAMQQEPCTVTSPELLQYDQVVGAVEHGKRVVVSAPPGHGKASLALKVRKDWASEKALQNIKCLFHVEMRKVERKIDIKDILTMHVHLSQREFDHTLDSLQHHGDKICFFFDGVTELNFPYIEEIANGSRFPNALIYVTCHVDAADHITEQINPHKVVRLNRFTVDQIYRRFEEKGTAKYLDMFPQLQELVRVPLHLGILEYILKHHSEGSPLTLTKLINSFCIHLIHHAKNKESATPTTFVKFGDFTGTEQMYFDALCDIALEGAISVQGARVQMITKEQVRLHCRPVPQKLGESFSTFTQSLLVTTKHTNNEAHLPDEELPFRHSSIAKYLAAISLSKLPQDDQLATIGNNVKIGGFHDVIKHFFGLTHSLLTVASKRDHLLTIFRRVLAANKPETRMLPFYCAYEAQSRPLCQHIVEQKHGPGLRAISMKGELESVKTLTPADSNVLGYVMSEGQMLTLLELNTVELTAKSLSMLNGHIKDLLVLTTFR